MLTASATVLILTAGSTVAQAAVWTDQTDYSPGSVVTFNGDNSDSAGYQAGETVHVDVNGPGGITQSCDATVDSSGAWSCQITLGSGAAAIGSYSYTATGQTSGVSQSGTFTDSACPGFNGVGTRPTDPNVSASFTADTNTATYTITSANEHPTSGVPGLISYCVYPGSTLSDSKSKLPDSGQAAYGTWAFGTSSAKGLFAFDRPDGDPSNLPFNGTTQTVGTATWNSGLPDLSNQTILLHINDPNLCSALYPNGDSSAPAGTCFVFPGTPSSGNSDLTVHKTANPSFTRTYTWGIAKTVDQTGQKIPAGSSATFNYTVAVTHDSGTDSNWQVTGKITVTNPNTADFTGVNVTDSTGGGGNCQVTDSSSGSNETIPANGSLDLPYTCNYSSNPGAVTDTATATWDKLTYNTPDNSATGTATADFTTATLTIVDGSVAVTDTLDGGTPHTLGTVTYTDPSPTRFKYPYTFSGDPAGTCTNHDNTATFTTDTSGTTGHSSQPVTVCVGEDLQVSKTANPSFTRTYNWGIVKSVNPAVLDAGGTATYNVNVTETGFADSNWQVTGTITVTNPNHWELVSLTGVTDAIDNGGNCTITSGDPNQAIAADGTATLGYTCTYAKAPSPASGTNTATATWNATAAATPDGTASGTATADFGSVTPTKVNSKITVIDSYAGTLGTVTATDNPPSTTPFTYTRKLTPPPSGCVTVNNIATIVETGQSSSASVKDCNTGALTMGFWQNKNGQALITGGASTSGVCNSGTWLRQYAPFQNLSATATCSQVATYVSTVIKAANASGAAMNAMLKGQMLATALDVYFSDPALGGNKIGATLPIGGVTIDLTKICHMIDSSSGTGTCSGTYENASNAFGPATSLTISQMLVYAASQSNAGGSTWYGQVKATQGLAKDAFDAINNQVASSP